jgi:hypothetical protein
VSSHMSGEASSKDEIRAAAREATMRMLNPPADRGKVSRIMETLTRGTGGIISKVEVKKLFSQLIGCSERDIPDSHEAVVAFAGLDINSAVESVLQGFKKASIDELYGTMFPYEASAATRTEAIRDAAHKAQGDLEQEERLVSEFERELIEMDASRHRMTPEAETMLICHRKVVTARQACSRAMAKVLESVEAENNKPPGSKKSQKTASVTQVLPDPKKAGLTALAKPHWLNSLSIRAAGKTFHVSTRALEAKGVRFV